MEKTVKIRVKTVYGNTLYYPANKPASLFAAIAGTSTLTYGVLKTIKDLGFAVEIVQDTLEL